MCSVLLNIILCIQVKPIQVFLYIDVQEFKPLSISPCLFKATAPRLSHCANAGFQRDYSKYLSGAELYEYYACGGQACNSASRKNVAASPHHHSRLGATWENGTFPSSRVWPGWASNSSGEVATIYIMQTSSTMPNTILIDDTAFHFK